MSTQLLQLSFHVDHNSSPSRNSPQFAQSSNKFHLTSVNSVSTADYSRHLKQCHDKPVFKPPMAKFIEDEPEPDDETCYSHNILVTTKSFPDQTNPELQQKAGSIPKMFSTKTASFHNLAAENPELLKPEDLLIDLETRPRGNSSSMMPLAIKDSDDEGLHSRINSYDSETVEKIENMQGIDNHVFEQRREKRASINSPTNVCSTALIPSRFALDATNRNTNLLGQSMDKNKHFSSIQLSPGIKSPGTISEYRKDFFIGNLFSHRQPASKKIWGKLGYVLQSLTLIQRHEANPIKDVEEIVNEITNFQLRTWKDKDKFAPNKNFYKADTTKDAFEKFRRNQLFWDCCAVGSSQDVKIIKKIIEKDPRKNMIEKSDPEHLLNQHSLDGYAPLHIAAQNGNLEVVKIFIEAGANHLVEAKACNGKMKDLPIELAVRWNHAHVVAYLLENADHPKEIKLRCQKNAENKHMKELIKKSLNSKRK